MKSLKNLKSSVIKNRVLIALIVITLLAAILRFINYDNRWGLAGDQARDVLVVRQALRLHTLPLIGPFSASGPYVFGPYWYWIFMIPVGLFFNVIIAPWIFQGILYVAMVPLMFLIGRRLIGDRFGLLLALFTTVSPAEINLSRNLIFSALIGVMSVGVIYFFVSYLKTKRLIYVGLFALLTGVAFNTHFEAAPLIILLPLAIWFGNRKPSQIALIIFLFLLPFVPLIIFNFQYHFYESTNIINSVLLYKTQSDSFYMIPLIKQYVVLFVNLLPRIWTSVLGGYLVLGYLLMIGFAGVTVIALKKKLIGREMGVLLIGLAGILVVIGLYKGTVFESFFAFLFPLILIFCAWMCYLLLEFKRFVGLGVILVLVLINLGLLINRIPKANNLASDTATYWEESLIMKFPKRKFAVYNYGEQNKSKSIPLSLFLNGDGLISDNDLKVGIAENGAPVSRQIILQDMQNPNVYNLDDAPDSQLKHEGFTPVDASKIYRSVEDWYK